RPWPGQVPLTARGMYRPPPAGTAGVPQTRLGTRLSVTATFWRLSSPVFVTTIVTLIGWPGPVASTHVLFTLSEGERGTLQVASSWPVAVWPEHAPVPVATAVSVNGPH